MRSDTDWWVAKHNKLFFFRQTSRKNKVGQSCLQVVWIISLTTTTTTTKKTQCLEWYYSAQAHRRVTCDVLIGGKKNPWKWCFHPEDHHVWPQKLSRVTHPSLVRVTQSPHKPARVTCSSTRLVCDVLIQEISSYDLLHLRSACLIGSSKGRVFVLEMSMSDAMKRWRSVTCAWCTHPTED